MAGNYFEKPLPQPIWTKDGTDIYFYETECQEGNPHSQERKE